VIWRASAASARRWVDPGWYRYLREQHPNAAVATFVVLLTCLGVGGFFTYRATAVSTASAEATYVPLMTTVTKVVRVREHGRVVLRRVAVVKRVFAKPVSVIETQTIQTPGGTEVVTRSAVHYEPVYRRKVIRVHGKVVTVNQVVTDTRMLTDTQLLTTTSVVTNEHGGQHVHGRERTYEHRPADGDSACHGRSDRDLAGSDGDGDDDEDGDLATCHGDGSRRHGYRDGDDALKSYLPGAGVNVPPRMLGQSPELQKMTCACGFSALIARRRKTSGLLWRALPSSSIDFASPRAVAIFWSASAVACATFASAC